MSDLEDFKRSYAVLQKFFSGWINPLEDRCKRNDQRRAAFYAWARFSMSLRTLNAILEPALLPDICVISRGCLEFDATLQAVIKDPQAANDYLEFEKHAKAHYLRILSKQNDIDRFILRREQFDQEYSTEPNEYRQTSWCAKFEGISGLIRKFSGEYALRVYNLFSHFAHGSVLAMEMLDEWDTDPGKMVAEIIECTYRNYLRSSNDFLSFVWNPLVTPEGERCKADFRKVLSSFDP